LSADIWVSRLSTRRDLSLAGPAESFTASRTRSSGSVIPSAMICLALSCRSFHAWSNCVSNALPFSVRINGLAFSMLALTRAADSSKAPCSFWRDAASLESNRFFSAKSA